MYLNSSYEMVWPLSRSKCENAFLSPAQTRGKQPLDTKFEFKCDNVTVWTFMCESWPKVAQVVRSCLQNAEVEQFKMQVAKGVTGVLCVRHRIAQAMTPSFQ